MHDSSSYISQLYHNIDLTLLLLNRCCFFYCIGSENWWLLVTYCVAVWIPGCGYCSVFYLINQATVFHGQYSVCFKEDHEKLSSLCKISHGKVLTICFPIITLTSFNFLPVLPNFRILFNKTCEVGISDEKFERDVE